MCAAASCRGRAARGLLEKTQPPSVQYPRAKRMQPFPASRAEGIHPGACAQQLPAAGGRHVDYLRERCCRSFYTYARSRSPPRPSCVPHGRNPSRCTCAAASCRRRAARGLLEKTQPPVRPIPARKAHAAVPRRARPASRAEGIHPGACAQQLPAAGGRHVDYLRERCRRPFYTYARSRPPPRTSCVPRGRNPSRCMCAAASCRRRAARGLPERT